jgi:hypothetical protein
MFRKLTGMFHDIGELQQPDVSGSKQITNMDSDTVLLTQQYVRHSLPTICLALIACLFYYLYRLALPKPIPGIPYDEVEAKKLFGSLPSMISHFRQHGIVMPWLTGHNLKHNAPLVQFFGAPFSQPTLVLSDFQESQDVLIRRTKEFERADKTIESFEGIMGQHQIAMKSTDARFKGNRELVRDLMSPNFLHEVSIENIVRS